MTKSKTVTISIDEPLIERVDGEADRLNVSRSKYISRALEQHFATPAPEAVTTTRDYELITKDLENARAIIEGKDALIEELRTNEGYLRAEFSKCNERLNRFLLPEVTETKRSFWSRFKRSK